jgi:hypothetical protein
MPLQNGIRVGENWPEFATNSASPAKAIKHSYIDQFAWLCWEAAANASLPSNSLICGKIQGIWSELGRRTTLDASLYKGLRVEFPTKQNREILAADRERSLSNRDRPRLSMNVRNG